MNGSSYYPGYFSIEDIMASQEKVPCITKVSFSNLGFIRQINDEDHISEGATLNVPIWLAKKLSSKQIKYLKVDIPLLFKEKTRDMLEADSKIVDLYRLNPYFYEYGLVFSRIKRKHGEIVRELLSKVFRERFRKILGWAINGMKDPCQIQELDLSEQRILRDGHRANDLVKEWFLESQIKLQPADVVIHLKKRKLFDGI